MRLSRARSFVIAALVAALFVFTSGPPAHAQTAPSPRERAAYTLSVGSVIATTAVDLATTRRAIDVYGATELNPVIRHRDGTPSYIAKAGLATADALLVDRLLYRRGHPRLATVTNFGVSALIGLAAHNNRRVIKTLEQPTGRPPGLARASYALQF